MYAFNKELKNAWSTVFANLHRYLPGPFDQPFQLIFEDDGNLFTHQDVLFAQQSKRVNPNNVSVIGQSRKTPGLPFILSKKRINVCAPSVLCGAMNPSLREASDIERKFLRLKQFHAVNHAQYDIISGIENDARASGYPELR